MPARSPRTTKLYDRTGDEIMLDEVEWIITIETGFLSSLLPLRKNDGVNLMWARREKKSLQTFSDRANRANWPSGG
jgi:hypothetical protein